MNICANLIFNAMSHLIRLKLIFVFLLQIIIGKNTYCQYKGTISGFLNSSLQEYQSPEFIIILIILFFGGRGGDPKNINTVKLINPEN